jgi:hypothetical protein
MRFKIFTAVAILIMSFWVKSSCWLVGRSQRFGEACCLHLQGLSYNFRNVLSPSLGLKWSLQPWRWRQHASPKRWLLPTNPRGELPQKNMTRISELSLISFWCSLCLICFCTHLIYKIQYTWLQTLIKVMSTRRNKCVRSMSTKCKPTGTNTHTGPCVMVS